MKNNSVSNNSKKRLKIKILISTIIIILIAITLLYNITYKNFNKIVIIENDEDIYRIEKERGKIFIVSPKSFHLSKTLTIKSNTIVYFGNAKLIASNGVNPLIRIVGKNVKIYGGFFDGGFPPREEDYGHMESYPGFPVIHVYNASNVILSDITVFHGYVSGISIDNSNFVFIKNIRAHHNKWMGVRVSNSRDVELCNVIAYKNTDQGIEITRGSSNVVLQNIITFENGGNGLEILGGPNACTNKISVANVIAFRNQGAGLGIYDGCKTAGGFGGAKDITISNLISYENEHFGLHIDVDGNGWVMNVIVTGFNGYKNGWDGIFIQKTKEGKMKDIIIEGLSKSNKRFGAYVEGIKDCDYNLNVKFIDNKKGDIVVKD